MTVRILNGDCRDVLKTLPSESVHCCVTSPPYFWLRDYGHEQQIGHEASVAQFVRELGDVFDEVRRVLTGDGVLWLNLGDSYYSGNGQPHGSDPKSPSRNFRRVKKSPLDAGGWGIPKKSLLGIPWLVALELQRRGWTLRADIVWCRPSAFQESKVTDRPWRQHEYLFLLSKARRYHFDRSALVEESVWHIGNASVDGHSAAYPELLVHRCIKAGCPAGGTVLDPFGGAGTTGMVADRLGRDAILIELNAEYAAIAKRRIIKDAGLLADVREAAE